MTALHEAWPSRQEGGLQRVFQSRFTAWWEAPRRHQAGLIQCSEAFKLMTNRSWFVGSFRSKDAFPQFSKFIALLELGRRPFAEEKPPPSQVESPCVISKNDIFMATPGCSHFKRGRPDLGSNRRWRPFKEENPAYNSDLNCPGAHHWSQTHKII